MERIVQGRSATLTHTFYVDATAADPSPDSATVVITRVSDGSTLTGIGTVDTSGVGTATVTLTPAHTALLDTLNVVWTATFGGQSQTFTDIVEVAGGYLCDLAELRAPFTSTTAYPTAKLADIRTEAEQRLEKACGRAFVPRYKLERQSYNGGWITTKPDLRTVRSLTVDGTVYTADDIANLTLENGIGWVSLNRYGWGCRSSLPITIGYEYGLDYPDADITRAVLLAAQEIEGVGSARPGVQSQTADNMSVTYFTSSGDSFADSTLNAIIRDNALSSLG